MVWKDTCLIFSQLHCELAYRWVVDMFRHRDRVARFNITAGEWSGYSMRKRQVVWCGGGVGGGA